MRNKRRRSAGDAFLSIACFALGLFLVAYGEYDINVDPQREIMRCEGTFQKYKTMHSFRSSIRYFTVGDRVFSLDSVGLPAFDDAFLTEVQAGDHVFVEYWDKEGAEDHVPRTLMGLRTDTAVYMDASEAFACHMRNSRGLVIVGSVFVGIGVVILLVLLERKHHILGYATRSRRYRGYKRRKI